MRTLRPALGIAKVVVAITFLAALAYGLAAMWNRSAPDPIAGSTGGAAGTASQAPVYEAAAVDLSPAEPADEPAGDCALYVTSYDGPPMTAELSASISTSVVVGTVQEVGPARWRTADEKAPTEQQDLGGDVVMRMIRISVDENLAGARTDGTIVAWVEGGAIGCHEFRVGGYPLDVKTGDRFTFFLDSTRNPTKAITGVARVVQMWPVDGTTVTTTVQGEVSVSDIEAETSEALSP